LNTLSPGNRGHDLQDTPRNTRIIANAVIRFYDEAGNVIQTHEHTGEFKEP
jgi:hypothetical protein